MQYPCIKGQEWQHVCASVRIHCDVNRLFIFQLLENPYQHKTESLDGNRNYRIFWNLSIMTGQTTEEVHQRTRWTTMQAYRFCNHFHCIHESILRKLKKNLQESRPGNRTKVTVANIKSNSFQWLIITAQKMIPKLNRNWNSHCQRTEKYQFIFCKKENS